MPNEQTGSEVLTMDEKPTDDRVLDALVHLTMAKGELDEAAPCLNVVENRIKRARLELRPLVEDEEE